jgi:hypothetical protein
MNLNNLEPVLQSLNILLISLVIDNPNFTSMVLFSIVFISLHELLYPSLYIQKTISLVKYNRGRHRGRGAEIYPTIDSQKKKQ